MYTRIMDVVNARAETRTQQYPSQTKPSVTASPGFANAHCRINVYVNAKRE